MAESICNGAGDSGGAAGLYPRDAFTTACGRTALGTTNILTPRVPAETD